ncbi:MAG: 30S ribosomal protein S28e [Candidatus Aenigmarchaeota archaeon]|nr:30S ribosomal protein S28e [Candidatus Aenigmarchaeota archaeon]
MDAYPAEVVEVIKRMGSKGVVQVRCKIIDGPEKGRVVVRNVVGPVRVGDVLMLKEIEMETAGKIEER